VSARARVRRFLPYVIVAAGGFLIGYLLIFLFVFPTDVVPTESRTPNVVGLTYDDAVASLRRAGFDAQQGETRFHATTPKGTVLEQDPPPGTVVPRDSRITLAVSGGQRRGRVPSVIGLARERAQVTLENAGFDVGAVEEQPSERPRGEVIATAPGADVEAPLPSTVTLFISAGPATLTMPDVVGRPFGEARSMLEQLGLVVPDPAIDYDSLEPASTVVAQSPGAGLTVTPGASVQLRVSGRSQ
jgi:eukaryotic-like serine/threonine-protein kinase